MKRFLFPVLLTVLAFFGFHCQKELQYSTGLNPGGTAAAPINATVQGRVLDENGQPANGVVIHAGGKTATTDAAGFFRIVKTSLDKNASVIIAEKSGYFRAYRTFQATAGANNVKIKLIRKTLAGTINTASGGNVTLANGAKIALPTNAVVKATGGTFSGSINVYAAYIDPTAGDIAQTIPGSLMADSKDGKRVTLSSYGMLAVELESPAGERLQIAAGKTATLSAPIPSSALSSAPSSISMWYVDEQTGIWKEDGSATKTGNTYSGEVKHFSFWNFDISASAVNLSMTIKNSQGIPLINTRVELTRNSNYWSTCCGYTDSMGRVSGLVPSNELLLMNLFDDCGNIVFTQHIGPFSQNTDLGIITVNSNNSSILTIQGRLVNCSGNVVTDGFVIINYSGYQYYVNAATGGDFAVSFFHCASSPAAIDVTGIDNAALQQNTVTGIPIILPVTNTGDIIACGTSALQFINYTLDGTNYSLSPSVSLDTVRANYYSTAGYFYTNLFGFNQDRSKWISLQVKTPVEAPGTYDLLWLGAQDFSSGPLLTPSTITFTSFPTATAGYYEGSFTSNFRDTVNPAPIHTISGTFRVRRF